MKSVKSSLHERPLEWQRQNKNLKMVILTVTAKQKNVWLPQCRRHEKYDVRTSQSVHFSPYSPSWLDWWPGFLPTIQYMEIPRRLSTVVRRRSLNPFSIFLIRRKSEEILGICSPGLHYDFTAVMKFIPPIRSTTVCNCGYLCILKFNTIYYHCAVKRLGAINFLLTIVEIIILLVLHTIMA